MSEIYPISAKIDFARQSIVLEFPDAEGASLADLYRQTARKTERVSGRGTEVRIEIPRELDAIFASHRKDGFVFHFTSLTVAQQWQDVLFRKTSDSPRRLYIKRLWDSTEELREALLEEQLRESLLRAQVAENNGPFARDPPPNREPRERRAQFSNNKDRSPRKERSPQPPDLPPRPEPSPGRRAMLSVENSAPRPRRPSPHSPDPPRSPRYPYDDY